MIAIDPNDGLVYEGDGRYGYGIWPSPFISPVSICSSKKELLTAAIPSELSTAKILFREDSFDPVTRIRRGRLYVAPDGNPCIWNVHTHPAYPFETGSRDISGRIAKRLFTFISWNPQPEFVTTINSTVMVLGARSNITLWNVIGVEQLINKENLITLRARSALGALPEINEAVIPVQHKAQIINVLDRLMESAFKAGPESVIDRCRDAVQTCLSIWMEFQIGNDKYRGQDLSRLIQGMENDPGEKKILIINSAKSIARLHARAKPNEQFKRDLRRVTESDAECSLALTGLLLRELGWAAG